VTHLPHSSKHVTHFRPEDKIPVPAVGLTGLLPELVSAADNFNRWGFCHGDAFL
jgi:hypothetical protein